LSLLAFRVFQTLGGLGTAHYVVLPKGSLQEESLEGALHRNL
jgi:hypothetical protein